MDLLALNIFIFNRFLHVNGGNINRVIHVDPGYLLLLVHMLFLQGEFCTGKGLAIAVHLVEIHFVGRVGHLQQFVLLVYYGVVVGGLFRSVELRLLFVVVKIGHVETGKGFFFDPVDDFCGFAGGFVDLARRQILKTALPTRSADG